MKKILSLITAFIMIISQCAFASDEEAVNKTVVKQGYDTVMTMIQMFGITDKTKEEIMQEALLSLASRDEESLREVLNAIARTIDQFSAYYTDEEYAAMQMDLMGKTGGIGITASVNGDYLEVISVIPDGAADLGGMTSGDVILSVDGTDTTGPAADTAIELIRGEIGQSVRIKFRKPDGTEYEKDFLRIEIKDTTVTSSEISEHTGYIRITHFSDLTGDEFSAVLDDFKAKNIENIIIDLRNNGGGTLSGALGVASAILNKGEKIVTFKGKAEGDENTYTDEEDSVYDFDIAVLVNEYTASASEVVTAALADNGHAVTIGSKTYGKGTVQGFYPIGGINGVLKMTVNVYLTPAGVSINKVGIQPQIDVVNVTKRYEESEFENFSYRAVYGLGEQSEDINKAEQILKLLGYPIDEPDGIMDEKTFEAIKMFQKSEELYPYGVLDLTTQNYLYSKLLNTSFFRG